MKISDSTSMENQLSYTVSSHSVLSKNTSEDYYILFSCTQIPDRLPKIPFKPADPISTVDHQGNLGYMYYMNSRFHSPETVCTLKSSGKTVYFLKAQRVHSVNTFPVLWWLCRSVRPLWQSTQTALHTWWSSLQGYFVAVIMILYDPA